MTRYVLVTDLDGTLIPLKGHHGNREDLSRLRDLLKKQQASLVYATGRHFASVVEAIQAEALPYADWILCDVGTTAYQLDERRTYQLALSYRDHLTERVTAMDRRSVQELLSDITGIRVQEPEKLSQFKLSYYADANSLPRIVEAIQKQLQADSAPWSVVASIDPFNGDGLVDVLPAGVTKAYAVDWWVSQSRVARDSVIFAGDSGNDLAALTAGYRSIVVNNADQTLVESVTRAHRGAGWQGRLHLATQAATSGVLEGCRHFWQTDRA